MDSAAQAEREKNVTEFRDKLIEGRLETAEELSIRVDLDSMASFMAESHSQLRVSFNKLPQAGDGTGYRPVTAKEEFALELYWASHWAKKPPAWFAKWIADSVIHEAAFDILKFVLKKYEHLKMKESDYEKLKKEAKASGLVGNDGTIFGFAKYEQLDEGWMISALNFILNVVHPKDIYHPFPIADCGALPMTTKSGAAGADPVLGIVGDWGGGSYQEDGANGSVPSPAERVLTDLKKQNMDYLFHLGDTYYAGTNESRLGPCSANEEKDNLIDLWPDQGPGRNYTLNSNHEMYGAAQGIFDTALTKSGLFDQQKGSSLFALEYPLKEAGKKWLVLGLDSAYFSDKENGIKMYMEGAIGSNKFLDWHKVQMKKITELCDGHDGPIMVMTHHNPCDTIKFNTNKLYEQVVEAIGKEPTLWIWGHVHNCIVYNKITDSKNHGAPLSMKGRCCGHGAVPYGPAWGLTDQGLPYVANTHDNAFPESNPRVYNGYGLVTLHSDGGYTETYYEIRKPGEDGVAAWSKTWTGSELNA